MHKRRLFPAALAVLAAVLAAGCSSTSPSFQDRTVTSSITPRAAQQTAKERYSGMATEGRTGYVKHRVERQPMF
jgi:outer membrane biogenesis lipoprotein LolB